MVLLKNRTPAYLLAYVIKKKNKKNGEIYFTFFNGSPYQCGKFINGIRKSVINFPSIYLHYCIRICVPS